MPTKSAWTAGQPDLNDMTALGYCDIVAAEKHWGSILRRHATHFRAMRHPICVTCHSYS